VQFHLRHSFSLKIHIDSITTAKTSVKQNQNQTQKIKKSNKCDSSIVIGGLGSWTIVQNVTYYTRLGGDIAAGSIRYLALFTRQLPVLVKMGSTPSVLYCFFAIDLSWLGLGLTQEQLHIYF